MGALKKMFIDDIDSIELLLAHALPEGWVTNLAVPAFVFLAMFFVDWKPALLSPVRPALGPGGHDGHVLRRHQQLGLTTPRPRG